jgi:hypothetical protein
MGAPLVGIRNGATQHRAGSRRGDPTPTAEPASKY